MCSPYWVRISKWTLKQHRLTLCQPCPDGDWHLFLRSVLRGTPLALHLFHCLESSPSLPFGKNRNLLLILSHSFVQHAQPCLDPSRCWAEEQGGISATDIFCIKKNLKFDIIQVFILIFLTHSGCWILFNLYYWQVIKCWNQKGPQRLPWPILSFYRWGNWGTEKLSELIKAIQPGSVWAESRLKGPDSQTCFSPLPHGFPELSWNCTREKKEREKEGGKERVV